MRKEIVENAGYISLEIAMSQANYVFKHHFSQDESLDLLLQQLVKINQEAGDSRIFKLQSLIKSESSFNGNWLKIAIAILLDLSPEKYEEDIYKLASFNEKNVDEDEKEMFVSILLCEIKAKKESILADFDNLKLPPIITKVEPLLVKTSSPFEGLADVDIEEEYNKPLRKPKIQKPAKQVFILHKKGPELSRSRPRKSKVSSKQKIMSVLEKHQSFLIYQEAFPLPSGIKRIKVKGNFDQIVVFIQEYVSQTNLPVQIIVEEDRAKVIFKKDLEKKQKKERYKTNIRIHAA